MTKDPRNFFKDNAHRIDAKKDPILYNLNHGLFALAEQLAALQSQQADQTRILLGIARLLEQKQLR